MSGKGRLLVISGPSGAGKTTIMKELLKLPGFERVVTYTTRPPRRGERDGVDYHFVDRADFERGIGDGRFLEFAEVYGHCYGTPRDQVEDGIRRGVTLVLGIDVQGARQLRQARIDPMTSVFVSADPATLEERLRRRGTESAEIIDRRLEVAREEMKEARYYDQVIVNEDVEEAVSQVLRALNQSCESV